MKLFVYTISILLTVGVGIYTFNFGTWAWKKGYKRGGLGAWLISLLTVALPLYLLFFLPR